MRACVYAISLDKGWQLRISLDYKIDLWWWLQGKHSYEGGQRELNEVKAIIMLAASMPLGRAVYLRDGFQGSAAMDRWSPREWLEYIEAKLKREPGAEQGGRDRKARLELETPRLLWMKGKQADVAFADIDPQTLLTGASRIADALEGRSLLEAELQQLLAERLPELGPAWRSAVQLAHLQGRVQLTSGVGPAGDALPGVAARRAGGRAAGLRCRRCGSAVQSRTPCGSCGSGGCAYCEACLALGRSRSCALLLRGSSAGAMPAPAAGGAAESPTGSLLDRWGLSPAQREAAGAALRFLAAAREPQPQPPRRRPSMQAQRPASAAVAPYDAAVAGRPLRTPLRRLLPLPGLLRRAAFAGPAEASPRPPRFLLWAVTGAGKTEMIFPLLRYVLDCGGRALVATPRRDVVLELAPRIAKAFPDDPAVVLYGGSPQRWHESRLFLATTHQLMRFYHAFDLVIIDELDAFPYHNDPMLAYAAENCCKPGGRFIFLSATPPAKMQREVRTGLLPHAKVPARFHGHPLPVPSRIAMASVEACLRRRTFPRPLLSALKFSLHRGAQVFVFVSRIRHIDPVVELLRKQFPGVPVEGTSSKDEHRADHVLSFRATTIRLLVTTTILERGVTVPKSDVYILDADSELFDEASLVQMAGRAGRSKDDPQGAIVFVSPEWTKSQRGAVRQIRAMNAAARKKGFLNEEGEVVNG
ncbi:helicase-related protein [Paenibacillus sp. M1]|uniref:Helicase-related protein n=1 Tax=Paenibacillus haidiansis TaxID=1574488 RepID=A0ABU7VX57_9BACL